MPESLTSASTMSADTTENPSILLIKTCKGTITKVTGDGLTGPNWVTWCIQMMSPLVQCEVESYVLREILQPSWEEDPVGHDNWKKNDNYTKYLITQNVADEPLVHIQHHSSSHTAWRNLKTIYEDKSQETAVTIIQNLWHTTAKEDKDINEHLTNLKKYWERLNLIDNNNFKIPEVQFKIAIISSLPPSWDNFTRPYISIQKGNTADPKVHATSQELIGVLKEEYVQHLQWAGKSIKQETVHQAATYNKQKPSLTSCLADADRCSQCNMQSHKTTNCRFLGQSKCGFCDQFGHKTKDCYSKRAKDLKRKYETITDKTGNKRKNFTENKKKEEKNEGDKMDDINDDERIMFAVHESEPSRMRFNTSKEGQAFNFDNPDVTDLEKYDMWHIFYNWLTNSATTLHICNQHQAFTNFHPLTATTVTGVGNLVMKAKGWGTVELRLWCNGHKYILQLEDVLYIPNNHNNLIALKKWDQQGRWFTRTRGVLTLITKDGTPVAQGTKVENSVIHGYHFWFVFHLISHFVLLKNGIKNEQRSKWKMTWKTPFFNNSCCVCFWCVSVFHSFFIHFSCLGFKLLKGVSALSIRFLLSQSGNCIILFTNHTT